MKAVTHIFVISFFLLRSECSIDIEPEEFNAQNQALHYFYVDGRIPETTLNRFLHPLLSGLDINKFGSKFTILNAADGSLILPESSTKSRWIANYRPTGNQNLDLKVIEDSILSIVKSDDVVQRPVNIFIITEEAKFDDSTITKLKDSNKNGEIFIMAPNAEDYRRQIYNLSNPEIYLDVIRNAVMKQPIPIYPHRANPSFNWEPTIDRHTIYFMVIDFEGVQPSSLNNNYTLQIDGAKAAPLYLCADSKMKECFESYRNSYEISLNNTLTSLYLRTNSSNDYYYCSEEDCRFIDSSRLSIQFRIIPLETKSMKIYTAGVYLNTFSVIFLIITMVGLWIYKRKKDVNRNNEYSSVKTLV